MIAAKIKFSKPVRDYCFTPGWERVERRIMEEARKRVAIKRTLRLYHEQFDDNEPTLVLVYRLLKLRERYKPVPELRSRYTLAEIFILAGCLLP
jgi:hypothetical protein